MTIVASGAISLGTTAGTNRSISAEFGGTQPHALSEYYRDGAYSPPINIPSSQTSIPASGAISFSNFYGTSAAIIELGSIPATPGYVYGEGVIAGGGVRFDGTTFEAENYSSSAALTEYITTWLTGGNASDYKAKVEISGASPQYAQLTGPTLNQYHNLGTTREWLWLIGDPNKNDDFTILVTVQDVATSTFQDSIQVRIIINTY